MLMRDYSGLQLHGAGLQAPIRTVVGGYTMDRRGYRYSSVCTYSCGTSVTQSIRAMTACRAPIQASVIGRPPDRMPTGMQMQPAGLITREGLGAFGEPNQTPHEHALPTAMQRL